MVRVRELAAVASVAMLGMSIAIGYQRFESDGALQTAVLDWIPGFANPAPAVIAERGAPPPEARIALTGTPPLPLAIPLHVDIGQVNLPAPKTVPIAPQRAVATMIAPPSNSGPKRAVHEN